MISIDEKIGKYWQINGARYYMDLCEKKFLRYSSYLFKEAGMYKEREELNKIREMLRELHEGLRPLVKELRREYEEYFEKKEAKNE